MLASGTTPDDRASGAPRRITARCSRLFHGGDLSGRPTGRAARPVRNRRAAGDGTGRASQRRLHGTPSPRLTGPPAAGSAAPGASGSPRGRPAANRMPSPGQARPTVALTPLREERRQGAAPSGTGPIRQARMGLAETPAPFALRRLHLPCGRRASSPHRPAGGGGGLERPDGQPFPAAPPDAMPRRPHAPEAPSPGSPIPRKPCPDLIAPRQRPHRASRPALAGAPPRRTVARRWRAPVSPAPPARNLRVLSHFAAPPNHCPGLRPATKPGRTRHFGQLCHHFRWLNGFLASSPALRIGPQCGAVTAGQRPAPNRHTAEIGLYFSAL